jgi:hypothetical protein
MRRLAAVGLFVFFLGTVLAPGASPQPGPDSSKYYRYAFELPENERGYWLAPHSYLKDLDPSIPPRPQLNPILSTFATPGEYEPVSFVIYAEENLRGVDVELSNLTAGSSRISREDLTLRTVMRAPQRNFYRSPPEDHRIANRFLPRFEPFNLEEKHLRQIWITLRVPEGAAPGRYEGQVRVNPANRPAQEVPFLVEVFPFELRENPGKQYGTYYRTYTRSSGSKSKNLILRELRDICAHGGSIVVPSVGIDYDMNDGEITADYSEITEFVDLLEEADFPETRLVVRTGFEGLAEEVIGHEVEEVGYEQMAEDVLESEALRQAAVRGLEGLEEIQQQTPGVELVVTHMDEVFNRGRLPLYIALTKIANEGPDFEKYITIHTQPGTDSLRKMVDPYVDIRGHHGANFEGWLNRGHTIEEYRAELEASGDEGWHYHNAMGAWMSPERQRVINGLYSWINPFTVRADWIYNSYSKDPLNDLDGSPENSWNYDYGYAFPSQEDSTIVPTRQWEAWREGIDDQKYIYTLESLIEQHRGSGSEVQRAEAWLEALKQSLPNPQDQPIREGRDIKSSPPFTEPTVQKYEVEDYQNIRYSIAQFIIDLHDGK